MIEDSPSSEGLTKSSVGSTSPNSAILRDGEAVVLRGTQNGLEIHLDSSASASDIFVSLNDKLEASPSFFSGARVTIRYSEGPVAGVLARLDDIAQRYQLTIVSIRSAGDEARSGDGTSRRAVGSQAGARPSARSGSEADEASSAGESIKRRQSGARPEPALSDESAHGDDAGSVSVPPKFLSGPIRSGSVLEFQSHVVVVGDVNPGAEIIANGSIIVLGRLRGVAHAGASGGSGFILALDLTPQQLRIGALVARAGDEGESTNTTEIAYASAGCICVKEFTGKLPAEILTAKL